MSRISLTLIILLLVAHPLAAQRPAGLSAEPQTRQIGTVVMSGIPEVPDEVEQLVRRYGNVRSVGFADWTHDGSERRPGCRRGERGEPHTLDRLAPMPFHLCPCSRSSASC